MTSTVCTYMLQILVFIVILNSNSNTKMNSIKVYQRYKNSLSRRQGQGRAGPERGGSASWRPSPMGGVRSTVGSSGAVLFVIGETAVQPVALEQRAIIDNSTTRQHVQYVPETLELWLCEKPHDGLVFITLVYATGRFLRLRLRFAALLLHCRSTPVVEEDRSSCIWYTSMFFEF